MDEKQCVFPNHVQINFDNYLKKKKIVKKIHEKFCRLIV